MIHGIQWLLKLGFEKKLTFFLNQPKYRISMTCSNSNYSSCNWLVIANICSTQRKEDESLHIPMLTLLYLSTGSTTNQWMSSRLMTPRIQQCNSNLASYVSRLERCGTGCANIGANVNVEVKCKVLNPLNKCSLEIVINHHNSAMNEPTLPGCFPLGHFHKTCSTVTMTDLQANVASTSIQSVCRPTVPSPAVGVGKGEFF